MTANKTVWRGTSVVLACMGLAVLAAPQAIAADPAGMRPPAVVVQPPVKVVPPPHVVEYVDPGPCGTRSKPPFTELCYGNYRPWFYSGCYWRHGFYVCPKPDNDPPPPTAFGPNS
ncbi:hypothetical protein [Prosthecomicrobium hirschii]|uniref:Uncharacterized protein n=1 Tax=Prosthecodimorpha hirschii TaxID=665126 RepID=A0A0P6WBU3_9HYPH|nr:hypothetical protein [Prosthecomicrobium hirschii]KPL52102.1 hypothetical protein ABB55_07585 [Prosthecomicrobium hirschii]MCW1843515.1 hypothetical protein [Prosthecomicrobium hirschii]TPQ49019.1 hypothetical protein C2U72_20755 [Prosthecomicrobium hirschii]